MRPVDDQTLLYAVQSLAPLILSLELPPPLVLPLQNGGIGAEWHTSGMNIELRVRKPYGIYAVLEERPGCGSIASSGESLSIGPAPGASALASWCRSTAA